jgi:hypothetical protein
MPCITQNLSLVWRRYGRTETRDVMKYVRDGTAALDWIM